MSGLPYKSGDSGSEITYFENWFQANYRFYAAPIDGVFGADNVAAVNEMQRRLSMAQIGEFDAATAARVHYSPPPGKRVLGIVFRGTGGIIGQDYVSRICQGAVDLVEEQNPQWAATMGGLPVGTAGGIGDPSMDSAAASAAVAGCAMADQRISADPKLGVLIGGYSAGSEPAAIVRDYVKAKYPYNYVCSFSLGDPTRPPGGCYSPFGPGVDPGGQGIGVKHYGDVTDPRHCWLSNHTAPQGMGPDMYTIVPNGVVGHIMQACEDMVGNFSFGDLLTWLQALIHDLPTVVEDAGITAPTIVQSLSSTDAFGSFLLSTMISALTGLIGGGNPDTLTGPAAAAKAAQIALTFLFAGTGPHIRYHIDEVWPGQTYLGLGIQHVRYWSTQYLAAHAA